MQPHKWQLHGFRGFDAVWRRKSTLELLQHNGGGTNNNEATADGPKSTQTKTQMKHISAITLAQWSVTLASNWFTLKNEVSVYTSFNNSTVQMVWTVPTQCLEKHWENPDWKYPIYRRECWVVVHRHFIHRDWAPSSLHPGPPPHYAPLHRCPFG